MLEICALASGSNGNCYYIGNENEAVLIDAGIYYKYLIQRLAEANLDINKIKAIFITHEHSDHIQGVRGCSRKLNIPVFINQKTFKKIPKRIRPDFVMYFETGSTIQIGDFIIYSFQKLHDAADPCAFRISAEGKSIGVLTDLGEIDDTITYQVGKCSVLFLESNYDRQMLMNGKYPEYLKKRIDSELGHLSNDQAFKLIKDIETPGLEYLFLSHISAENNTVDLAMKVFSVLNGSYQIIPTSRHGISEVLHLF